MRFICLVHCYLSCHPVGLFGNLFFKWVPIRRLCHQVLPGWRLCALAHYACNTGKVALKILPGRTGASLPWLTIPLCPGSPLLYALAHTTSVPWLTTPTTQAAASAFFSCPSVPGGPLEDSDGGSHWEYRFLPVRGGSYKDSGKKLVWYE